MTSRRDGGGKVADDHGVTHEQLAKQIGDLSQNVESMRSQVSGIHAQVAVMLSKIEQGDHERSALRHDVRDLRTSQDRRTGMESAVKWMIGIASAIVSGGFVAWIAGLFSGGRGA